MVRGEWPEEPDIPDAPDEGDRGDEDRCEIPSDMEVEFDVAEPLHAVRSDAQETGALYVHTILSLCESELGVGPGVAESGLASNNVFSDDVMSSSISTATALRDHSFCKWSSDLEVRTVC